MRLIKRKYLESVTSQRLWGRFSADLGPAEEVSIGSGLVLDPITGVMDVKEVSNDNIAEDAAIATSKLADGGIFEFNTRKVTALSSESTNEQYPGAKLLFDELAGKENAGVASALDETILSTAKSYADALVVGLWDDRGGFDASVNTYPVLTGSSSSGTILKGDIWTISVIATSGALLGYGIGSTVRSLIDNPGQTPANWSIELHDIGYTPENVSNKNTSGGYAGLTLFKLSLKNALGTVTNFFTTAATIARTWTMPDKDGTVALLSDIPSIDNSIEIPATTLGYDGTIIRLTSAVVLAFGDVCYINLSGKAALASAAIEVTATGVVLCVEPTLAANTEGIFLLYGIARKDTWNWTVGGGAGILFLSISGASGNTLAQTVVSAEDNVSQILGFATHATRIFFNPSLIQTVYKA